MAEKFKKLCILYILFLWIGWYNQAETWGGIAFAKKVRAAKLQRGKAWGLLMKLRAERA